MGIKMVARTAARALVQASKVSVRKTPPPLPPSMRPPPSEAAMLAAMPQTKWGKPAWEGYRPDGTPAFIRNVDVTGLRFNVIDAEHLVLGRLAAQIATILQGKNKPTYDPSKDMGDVCVVVNAEKVHLTGNKKKQMLYRWHTGFPGGLKQRTVQEQLDRKPEEVIRHAVSRMLPKNKLRDARLRKLRLFSGEIPHGLPQDALSEWHMPPRDLRKSKQAKKRVLEEGQYPLIPVDFENWMDTGDETVVLVQNDPSHTGAPTS